MFQTAYWLKWPKLKSILKGRMILLSRKILIGLITSSWEVPASLLNVLLATYIQRSCNRLLSTASGFWILIGGGYWDMWAEKMIFSYWFLCLWLNKPFEQSYTWFKNTVKYWKMYYVVKNMSLLYISEFYLFIWFEIFHRKV